jgi:two-component system cell cycle sensor histidine kinase/response regulator CckA
MGALTRRGGAPCDGGIGARAPSFRGVLNVPPSAPAPEGPLRVLVMDDEPSICACLQMMLEALDFDADTCLDGRAAIARVEAAEHEGRPYDVVILDLMIEGGMGGQDAVRVLKSRWPALRAVLSTGYLFEPAALQPRAHGFDASLPKPYTIEQLLDAVSSAVEGADATMERARG